MNYKRFGFALTLPFLVSVISCNATVHTVSIGLASNYRLISERPTSTKPLEYSSESLQEWTACETSYFKCNAETLFSVIKDEEGNLQLNVGTFRFTKTGEALADATTYDCTYSLHTYVARQGSMYSSSGTGGITLSNGTVLKTDIYSRTRLFIDLPENFLGMEGEARTLEMYIS